MLTDAACKNAVCPPDRKHLRVSDSGGLFLEVNPNGSKRFFWRYTFAGKVRALPIGQYTAPGSKTVVMSLKEAREATADARKARKTGADPIQQRRADKLAAETKNAITFEAVAREFFDKKFDSWAAAYADRWIGRMEKDLFPIIGSLPVASIGAPLLLDALRRVEQRGAHDTAHTLRQTAGQVFTYAIQTGRCELSPAPHLKGALKPVQVKHMSAVLEPADAGALLRAIDTYAGHPVTRAALVLSALVFQRPGNVRAMEWSEVKLDAAVPLWTIPSAKMKRVKFDKVNGRPHLVPLVPQAVAILEDLRPLTGHGKFVFPSLLTGERCMSENTIRAALRRMGYTNQQMTPHGFRAMARTLIAERVGGVASDVIEAQLAHGKSGPLGAAYDRAEFMEQRRAMMNAWADYLDVLRVGAKVIKLSVAA